LWYVTNGLLVVEMLEGLLQVGDAAFEPHHGGPATENVAGDPGPGNGPTSATTAALRDLAPQAPGSTIVATIDASGNVGQDDDYLAQQVTAVDTGSVTGHTVASVFWEFMNASGPVWVDGALVTDRLFAEPVYAVGLPLTGAYWTEVLVGGTAKDVLLQCFERRCLTYTPDNPEGWQVEAGNVGQHYYRWRYTSDNGPGDRPERLFVADLMPASQRQMAQDGPGGRAAFLLDESGQVLHYHLQWYGAGNL